MDIPGGKFPNGRSKPRALDLSDAPAIFKESRGLPEEYSRLTSTGLKRGTCSTTGATSDLLLLMLRSTGSFCTGGPDA